MHQIQDAVRIAMQQGGRTVDRFNPLQATTTVGLQLVDLSRKVAAIAEGGVSPAERDFLANMAERLSSWGHGFAAGNHMGAVGRSDHAKLIAADFMLAWDSLEGVNSTAKFALAAVAEGCNQRLHHGKNADFDQFVDPSAKD